MVLALRDIIDVMEDIAHDTVNLQGKVKAEKKDEDLMLAYQAGDLKAFEELYMRHKTAVFRYLVRQGISHAIAEELLQEVWSAIIKGRKKYKPSAKFTTWLYQISRHRLIDYFRRHQTHLTLLDDDEVESDEEYSSDELTKEEQLEKVLVAVAELPFPQRQAFLLHYEAGLSSRQVSEITQEHPEAVKSSLRYAIRKLKLRLGLQDD